MTETLTCPECKAQIRTDKTIGIPNEKRANCPKCKTSFTLGEARVVIAPRPKQPTAVPPPAPKKEVITATRIAHPEPTQLAQVIPVAISQPISPMFRFCADGQNVAMVEKLLTRIKEICTSSEEPLYMAVQQKPVANFSPDAIVLTNRRVLIFRQKILGRMDFKDCAWLHVANVHMKENILGATISVSTTTGGHQELDHIPKSQARQIYRIAQEMEERMLEERRNRAMEEDRNRAGQVIVQNAIAPYSTSQSGSADDPMQSLAKLKSMLDAGLISETEFNAKKADILSRM